MSEFHIYNWIVVVLMFFIAVPAIVIVPFWKIFERAGWPGALSLLMVVPLLNLGLLWGLAFKAWPGDEKAKQ